MLPFLLLGYEMEVENRLSLHVPMILVCFYVFATQLNKSNQMSFVYIEDTRLNLACTVFHRALIYLSHNRN